MTRSKKVGRGRAPGSRRALAQANAERQRRAEAKKAEQAPAEKPTERPHLRAFQTPEQMAELRRRRAEKRPEAVAARVAQAQDERRAREEAAQADGQAREAAARAERERLAREAERQRNRGITILMASRWLGESPLTTLIRVGPNLELPPVMMADGSTRVRVSDVARLIWKDATQRPWPLYHTPSPRPCAIGDGHLLAVPQWALIFGAVPRSDVVIREPQTLCPQCGRALEAGWVNPDGTVPYRCSMFQRCDYVAVRRGDEWLKPPAFWSPWSAPGPERVVERRLEILSFAQARTYFVDPEADLMPDFQIPAPARWDEPVPIWVAACWLGESIAETLGRIRELQLAVVKTNDGRVLIPPTEVQRVVQHDAVGGIPHRYRPQLMMSATQKVPLRDAARVLGEPPCDDTTPFTWSEACEILGRAADELYAVLPPFDYPEPAPRP